MADDIGILGSISICAIVAVTIAGVLTGHDGILVQSAFGMIATLVNITVLQLLRKHAKSRGEQTRKKKPRPARKP